MQMSYSELRQNLKQVIESTHDTHTPTIITSHNKPTAVLMSYEDYCSLEETVYLLRSPANAQRLLNAILDLSHHKNKIEHGLIEDET